MPMLEMPDIFSSACMGSLSQYDQHNTGNSHHDEHTMYTAMLVGNSSRTDAAQIAMHRLCIHSSEFCKYCICLASNPFWFHAAMVTHCVTT